VSAGRRGRARGASRPSAERRGWAGEAGEAGAATVLVVAMASVVLLVGCATAAVGGLLHARRAAESAADLAALAGAAAVQQGRDGCAAATGVVRANGAEVLACRVDGEDVVVTAAVPGPSWAGPDVRLEGTARAGPIG
jgi:secretion/DNA translocation related TadE-like protein